MLLLWRIIPSWNMESQSEDEFDINLYSNDESIIDRMLHDKKTSELE